MKCIGLLALTAYAVSERVSPIEKVLALMNELEAKIIKEGEGEQKLYEEFVEYCDDTSKETQFEIKTGKAAAERSSAAIDASASSITEATTKIEELSSSIATNEADLKAAVEIREKEKADFAAVDKDLAETNDMLRRAIGIIEKAMNGGSFLQGAPAMDEVAAALQTLIDAPTVSSQNKAVVQAFLEEQADQPAGAPAPAAYENQSGGILQQLEDMLEQSETQRKEAQDAEMKAKFNFDMLKQKLEDEIAAENKELAATKKDKASSEEAKATAEGDLEKTQKQLAEDGTRLKDLQHECMTKASDHETSQQERSEELEALATAKKFIEEKTGGAAARTYSFIQLSSRTATRNDAAKARAVALIQRLAKAQHAPELAQLAARLRSAAVLGADPFAKVKQMIQEMVEKLVKEAAEEAAHKAFCDKEMSETEAKKADSEEEVDDLNTKIDKATAKIAKLEEDIKTLQGELADIAAEQKQATEMRQAEKEEWAAVKADLEGGIEGVQMALQVLRDYYAQKDDAALVQTDVPTAALMQSTASKQTGAASGIIGLLEVAESDFSRNLAEGQVVEDTAQKEYEKMSQENEVATATKETAVKYKTEDQKETEAALAELKDDLSTSQSELDAVNEYYAKLRPQCVAKPEPYEERKKRREEEIAGLKQALEILENESGSSFLQLRTRI